MFGNREIMEALYLISRQVNHCERMLLEMLNHSNIALPDELVRAGKDLSEKTKALRAALEAQQQNPNQQKGT
jgi:hypothetical protein